MPKQSTVRSTQRVNSSNFEYKRNSKTITELTKVFFIVNSLSHFVLYPVLELLENSHDQ